MHGTNKEMRFPAYALQDSCEGLVLADVSLVTIGVSLDMGQRKPVMFGVHLVTRGYQLHFGFCKFYIQLTLVISTSLISNNRLSRSENLLPA